MRRFNEVAGGEPVVREITKQTVVAFLDALRKMPKALTEEQRKLPLPRLLEQTERLDGIRRVSPGTVRKLFSAVSALVEHAKRYDFTESNPFEGLRPSAPDVSDSRTCFSNDDLKLIFERSPLYRGSKSVYWRKQPGDTVVRDEKFWLPLLGLYTGARLDELGQLLLTDVRKADEIAYLDLNTIGEGKHLKNRGSRRRVPIHPELINCGFLSYVADLRQNGETQVFPALSANENGIWTSAASKWLNSYLDDIGISDRRKVIHSFRHNFKDACRAARVPESVHDALTGHSNGSVGRGYGLGEPLEVLAEAVARISYPVDLCHLHCSYPRRT